MYFIFSAEIHALQGIKEFDVNQLAREVAATIWAFTLLLLLHYLHIIFFQTPILHSIFGFIAFFVVVLPPVMIILSVFSTVGRKYGWSYFAIAILSSGLIAWMFASTLSFNA